MRKTWLEKQILLASFSTSDLLTDAEYDLFASIVSLAREVKNLNKQRSVNREQVEALRTEIDEKQAALDALIKSHGSEPRQIRLKSVLAKPNAADPGVSWHGLRMSRKIAEFSSTESRAMGLKHLDQTFDKIILKWHSLDILEQVVLYGFTMPVLLKNQFDSEGNPQVLCKRFRVITASAGQLRTDKVQCVSEEIWQRIEPQMMCGLTWDIINEKGGININKFMAYLALPSSATVKWNFDLDRAIVVKDFIGQVIGLVDFINPDYTIERGIRTVEINHVDGCGMMLPSVSTFNFMVRGPWLKGLLGSFDFIRFCLVHNVPAVIEDVWGKKHDLIQENIQVIFTESQLKLWEYYDSWEQYKQFFRTCNCTLGRCNFEERYIPDTEINYQMLQTLQTLTDSEIESFTRPTFDKIRDMAKSKEAMLSALEADPMSANPSRVALALYPELLRETWFHESLKNLKRRWQYDAMSGRIKCANKRLFVLPDLYAVCEYYFLHDEHPNGLIRNGEVYARLYTHVHKVDILRSPHLYMEHAVRVVANRDELSQWFYTNAIYTSVKDLISRILQFDCDGDQLNIISEQMVVNAAERELKEKQIVPLFYDANTSPKEQLTPENFFNGFKRAHDNSGIGEVSNALCRLWNRPNPDYQAAALLCYYNNQVIDGAKTGKINTWKNYPVAKRISKAIGGDNGKMPYFFKYSKNGRKQSKKGKARNVRQIGASTMDRICSRFSKVGNLVMNYEEIAPFNPKMLLPDEVKQVNQEAVNDFKQLDDLNIRALQEAIEENALNYGEVSRRSMHITFVTQNLLLKYGSLESIYPSIVCDLFMGEGRDKQEHKNAFWQIFGDLAVKYLKANLVAKKVCPGCGMTLPPFQTYCSCTNSSKGYLICKDCGKKVPRLNAKQTRCPDCQKAFRKAYKQAWAA